MMFKEKITQAIQNALSERPSLFLIDVKISEGNKVSVVLDGDNGVNLQDCIDVSRAIENSIDREEHDFSLEVASAGAAKPLQMVRQYKKKYRKKVKSYNDFV